MRAQAPAGTPVRLGPETLVSNNTDGGWLRCEPAVAASGDTVVVTWNDSYGGSHGSPTGVAIAWGLSRDRGKTFSFGGYLPRLEDASVPSGADSIVIADRHERFLLLVLSWQKDVQTLFLYEMQVERPGKWTLLSRFSTAGNKLSLIDRPYMYIDARGQPWITFTTIVDGEQQIAVIRSRNRGQTWEGPVIASDGPGSKLPSRVITHGQTVTVVWVQSSNASTDLRQAVSQDDGKTFSQPTRLAVGKPPSTISGYVMGVSQQARALYTPNLEIQASSQRSEVAVVMDYPAEKSYEVVQGVLPSGRLQPIFPEYAASFFPAVGEATYGSAILAYCRRSDSPVTDVCLSVPERDGRRTVLTLNSTSTDWSKTPGDHDTAPVQRNFGDYISITATKTYLIAVWTDGRSGAPRIFSRVIEIHS